MSSLKLHLQRSTINLASGPKNSFKLHCLEEISKKKWKVFSIVKTLKCYVELESRRADHGNEIRYRRGDIGSSDKLTVMR